MAVPQIVSLAVVFDDQGLDALRYAGHSLRAGLATSVTINGTSERSIMVQTGHRSLAILRRYIRDGSLFREKGGAVTGPALEAPLVDGPTAKRTLSPAVMAGKPEDRFERSPIFPTFSVRYTTPSVPCGSVDRRLQRLRFIKPVLGTRGAPPIRRFVLL